MEPKSRKLIRENLENGAELGSLGRGAGGLERSWGVLGGFLIAFWPQWLLTWPPLGCKTRSKYQSSFQCVSRSVFGCTFSADCFDTWFNFRCPLGKFRRLEVERRQSDPSLPTHPSAKTALTHVPSRGNRSSSKDFSFFSWQSSSAQGSFLALERRHGDFQFQATRVRR